MALTAAEWAAEHRRRRMEESVAAEIRRVLGDAWLKAAPVAWDERTKVRFSSASQVVGIYPWRVLRDLILKSDAAFNEFGAATGLYMRPLGVDAGTCVGQFIPGVGGREVEVSPKELLDRFDRRTRNAADEAMQRVDFDFGRGVPAETVERIREAASKFVDDGDDRDLVGALDDVVAEGDELRLACSKLAAVFAVVALRRNLGLSDDADAETKTADVADDEDSETKTDDAEDDENSEKKKEEHSTFTTLFQDTLPRPHSDAWITRLHEPLDFVRGKPHPQHYELSKLAKVTFLLSAIRSLDERLPRVLRLCESFHAACAIAVRYRRRSTCDDSNSNERTLVYPRSPPSVPKKTSPTSVSSVFESINESHRGDARA